MTEQQEPETTAGKPPKDVSQMRSVLKNVHAANASRDAGQHAQGLGQHEPIHLISFFDSQLARKFQKMLSGAGIPSWVRSEREKRRIEVEMEDRDRAKRLLTEFQLSHVDRENERRNQRFDLAILGLVLGLTIGLVLSLATVQSLLDLARIALVGAIGGLLGHLGDRVRIGSSHLRFGVYEFLILIMLPALAIVVYRITPALVLK